MATPTEHDHRDDPKSTKLPPAHPQSSGKSEAKIPTEGVSPQIKIFVIGLTFFTVMAFGIFAALMIKKIFLKNDTQEVWGPQLLTIAQQLQERGLRQEAVDHYQRYLDTQTVDNKTRSRISLSMAALYLELGLCDKATVSFLHAQAAQPEAPEVHTFKPRVGQCRSNVSTSE